MDIQADIPDSALEARRLNGNLSCEPPNSDLHNFLGNFAYRPEGSATQSWGLRAAYTLMACPACHTAA